MRIPREQVLEFLTQSLDERVRTAERELPRYVDTEKDVWLLDELGIDATALIGQFNGHRTKA